MTDQSKYPCACFICGKESSLLIAPFRNDQGNVTGFFYTCDDCEKESVDKQVELSMVEEKCRFCGDTHKKNCCPDIQELLDENKPNFFGMDEYSDEIEILIDEGHTDHCAKRIVWCDGECECNRKEKSK